MMHMCVLALAAGNHVAGWRLDEAEAGSQNLPLLKHIIQTAERGKFDLFFLADALNTLPTMHPSMVVRFEPITLLSVLSTVTTHIGLGATASTTYSEPYNLARLFASLDHLSGGRAAWNVVGGAFPDAAANFGKPAHPPHAERYSIAREFIEVMKGLWDSWEEDALVMDKASGQFIDAGKMHVLNHEGEHFRVKGPLNITRPPQGYPVIVQAGGSDAGRDLAAATAEVVYAVVPEMEMAKSFRDDIRQRAERFGRDPGHVKVLPGVCTIVGETEADARKKLAALGEKADHATSLRVLSERVGHDLSEYPLDGPVPDLPPSQMMQGHAVVLMEKAKREKLTIRQLRDITTATMGHRLLAGTPEQIADGLEEWFAAGAADGYNLMPHYFPGAFDEFVDHVIPVLQKRGLFRTEYTGTTLRDHLGLPRPEHPAKVHTALAELSAAE